MRLVVSFQTTADALEAEKVLKKISQSNANCGRLIPVPRNVSAGCGMAWKDEIIHKEEIKTELNKAKIEKSDFYEIEFSEKL